MVTGERLKAFNPPYISPNPLKSHTPSLEASTTSVANSSWKAATDWRGQATWWGLHKPSHARVHSSLYDFPQHTNSAMRILLLQPLPLCFSYGCECRLSSTKQITPQRTEVKKFNLAYGRPRESKRIGSLFYGRKLSKCCKTTVTHLSIMQFPYYLKKKLQFPYYL